jgi:hypothetical protein
MAWASAPEELGSSRAPVSVRRVIGGTPWTEKPVEVTFRTAGLLASPVPVIEGWTAKVPPSNVEEEPRTSMPLSKVQPAGCRESAAEVGSACVDR